jgi:hypothetical protein
MRTPYPGCDPATTGIDDADARIDRSRDEARRMAAAARAAFPRMSTRTIRLANRHFHCPSSSHIRAVMAALAAIEAMIPPLDVRCVSERTAQCRVPRYWEISNGVLKICPRVLADDFYFADVLIWALFAGAADGAGLALTCSILSPCYDDFTVPASVMVGEQYSYIGFAIELAGLPVHQAPTIPCAPFATGTYVVVPPGAVSDPTLIRPVTGFEPTPPPGSVVLTVHKDSSGNEFIYHGDLPGAEQYMPNEPKRYYFPGGRAP